VLAVPASAVSTPNATLNALVNTYGCRELLLCVWNESDGADAEYAGDAAGRLVDWRPD